MGLANLDTKIAPALQFGMPSSSVPVLQPTIQVPVVRFPNQQLAQVTSALKTPTSQTIPPEASLQSSPAREEGEVPESELDPDTRRRLLIWQHGQDSRERASSEPQFSARTPLQASAPRSQGRGWFPVEEEMSPQQVSRVAPQKEYPLNSEPLQIEKHRPHPPFDNKVENPIPPDRAFLESQRIPKEVLLLIFIFIYIT